MVRQGIELHRALHGAVSRSVWQRWQTRELHAWLMRDPSQPPRLEVRTPQQLHRVARGLYVDVSHNKSITILRATYSAQSATVVFGFQRIRSTADHLVVTLHTDGDTLTASLGEPAR